MTGNGLQIAPCDGALMALFYLHLWEKQGTNWWMGGHDERSTDEDFEVPKFQRQLTVTVCECGKPKTMNQPQNHH